MSADVEDRPAITPASRPGGKYQRQKPDPTTVPIKIPGELLVLLRMETKIGPRVLLLAVARVLMWGEGRHNGGRLVRLPPDDVEAILDALDAIAVRMEAIDERNSRAQARALRRKMDTMITRALRHGWDVDSTPAGYRISRLAPSAQGAS